MRTEHQLQVARLALDTCGSRGYVLAGSLALHVHDVAGARDPDDIDLFVNELLDDAEAVRGQVTQALSAAGYHVDELAAWGRLPDVESTQNAYLRVSHPQHGTARLQMICMARYLKPVERFGMPVSAIGECLYRKIESLQNRIEAKDFIDLVLLRDHMSQANADRYIRMYVKAMAHYDGRPEGEVARDLYQAYVQVAQIPDEAFSAYDYTSAQAVEIRTTILAWADHSAPPSASLRRDTALAAGSLPITYQDVEAALHRMAHDPSITRLSDQQLSTRRAEATTELLQAVSDGHATAGPQQRLQPISDELQRRATLTPQDRAAEDAVRRAEASERMVGGDPGRLGPHGVLARLRPPPPAPRPPTRTAEVVRHQHNLPPEQHTPGGRQL